MYYVCLFAEVISGSVSEVQSVNVLSNIFLCSELYSDSNIDRNIENLSWNRRFVFEWILLVSNLDNVVEIENSESTCEEFKFTISILAK